MTILPTIQRKLEETLLKPAPQLLSRNWMVFQIPSGTIDGAVHFVVGTPAEGFRCSCLGYSHHKSCYHSLSVTKVMDEQLEINGKQWEEFNNDRLQFRALSEKGKGRSMAARVKVEVRGSRGKWTVTCKALDYSKGSRSKTKAVQLARAFCRKHEGGRYLELFIYKANGKIQDRSTYPSASDPRHRKG